MATGANGEGAGGLGGVQDNGQNGNGPGGPGMGEGGNKNRGSKNPAKKGLSVIGPPPKSKTKKSVARKGLAGVKTPGFIEEETNKTVVTAGGYTSKVFGDGLTNSTEPPREFKDANPGLEADPMGMQNAWNAEVRGANGVGIADPGETLDADDQRALSQMPTSTAKLQKAKVERARSMASHYNPGRSSLSRALSSIIPGVDTYLSYDKYGNLGYDKGFAPTEFALGLTNGTTSPIMAGVSGLSALAGKVGFSPHKTYRNFQTIAEANIERANNNKQRAALGKGSAEKPKTIYETAIQTLYPAEEQDNVALGIGVSTGASEVRSAPLLSQLARRRASFGRVR